MRNLLNKQGDELCNFYPCVDCIIDIRSDKGEGLTSYVQMRLDFEDNHYSRTFTVPISELDQFKWLDVDIRCRYKPNVHQSQINRYLADAVRGALSNVPRNTVYQLNHTGVSVIEGEALYCIGQEVIRPPADAILGLNIEAKLIAQRLDIDTKLTEVQAASEMFDLISLSLNPGRMLLAYKLIYLMRQAYVDAGVTPNICMFLYGRTGTQKTTFSSFLTQMYDRSKGIRSPSRLNASIAAAVQILLKVSDDVVILDDLFPADSKKVCRQQEETLIEITRFIGDGTVPVRMRGNKLAEAFPKCGVIFTGEYLIGSGSDAARILPVQMMQPDGEKLKYFQDHPLLVSTFYYFYIVWFINHYKRIVSTLKEWLNHYRKTNLGVHDRLQQAHFFFNTAFSMLLQYYYEKNMISDQDAKRLHENFSVVLMELVQQQNERVQANRSVGSESVNYLDRIRTLYKNGSFSIADTVTQFDEKLHDGVIHNKCLFLRGEKLSVYFPGIDIADIADDLFCQGALKTGKQGRSIQISTLHGKRFYAIFLNRLE